jgi:signal transduction histidine kinase
VEAVVTSKRAFWLAATVLALSMGLLIVGVTYGHSAALGAGGPHEPGSILPLITTLAFVVSFASVGALLSWKRPSNPVGWLLSVTGLSYALATFAIELHHLAGMRVWADWLGNWLWGFGIGVSGTFLLLLFPTGTLPSRRWRWVARIAAAGLAGFVLGSWFTPGVMSGTRSMNPLGVGGPLGSMFNLLRGAFVLVPAAVVASIASVALRFRRARDLERQQMKWLVFAAGLILLAILAQLPISAALGSGAFATNVNNAVLSGAFVFVPIAIGIAVLKYRLYEIDVIVNRTVVYGLLAAFITAVYVAIVVGIGAALRHGTGSTKPNLGLSILATAVVAVAFQPVRERVQRFANRLVYGKRATPYEVLAGFVRRVAGTYAAEEVLPRMARALAEGTGAATASVWLVVGDALRREAASPIDPGGLSLPLSNGELPEVPGASLALAVRDGSELLGALSLTKRPGEPLTSTEEKLARDLAGQAALVLRNVGLTEQLLARLADIEVSRSRMVSAEEDERLRIERRIDEGVRRDLSATASALDEAASQLHEDPEGSIRTLQSVATSTTRALEGLREVARGIYPPLLADKGLSAALSAQAARAPIPISVDGDGDGDGGAARLSEDVESTIYFCCLEALENVLAHSGASNAHVELSGGPQSVAFEISDDGRGFDPSVTPRGGGLERLADRLAALDGTLEVRSTPGHGTTIRGVLPVAARTMELVV